MEQLNKNFRTKPVRPIKVLQFGEGNFLRGFTDYMIDIMNEAGDFQGDIVLVKPIEYGNLDLFREQDYLYTVSLRGLLMEEEKVSNRLITSIADAVDPYKEYERYAALAKLDTLRFVISNTTEAGIVYDEDDRLEACPPRSYPGKLVKFLYERYQYYHGAKDKGLIILPVELIDDNGVYLKEISKKLADLWRLEKEFIDWLDSACNFCSTLVDRIITGFPKEEAMDIWNDLGYEDQLLVTGEPFALWVIESSVNIEEEFPVANVGLPVVFTDNQKPYKQRKVRILNGAHTSFALLSYLVGNDTVLDSMKDEEIYSFLRRTVYNEIIPTLSLPKKELISFADSVLERFRNPFIKHSLLSISLNSVSKWRARCLPSLLEYVNKYQEIPSCLAFSMAALTAFYCGNELKGDGLLAYRNDKEYLVRDDKEVLEFFAASTDKASGKLVEEFLAKESFWGENLTSIPGFASRVAEYLWEIKAMGIRFALRGILETELS